jgi:hypothetical protein
VGLLLRSAVTCATKIQSRLLLRALLSPAASAIGQGSLNDKLRVCLVSYFTQKVLGFILLFYKIELNTMQNL